MSATLLAVSFGLAIGPLLGLVGAVDHARIGRVQMRTAVACGAPALLPREDPLEQGSNCSLARVGAVGVGAGVLTGFFRIGGGFVILPSVVLP
jgi:hypothetical protein